MKKKFALLTAVVLLLSLFATACGNTSEDAAGPDEPAEKVSETVEGAQDAAILDAPPSDVPAPGEDADAQSEAAGETSAAPEEQDTPAAAVSEAPEKQDETPEPTEAAVITTTPKPTATPAATPTPAPTPEPTPEPVQPAAPTREAAVAYIGKSASSMIAAIGAPVSSSYVSSCLGDGEDGELIYDGFTVYTYREGGSETVQDVL